MAAELIRRYRDPRRNDELISVYRCSGCGEEVHLKRMISGKNTYCAACISKRNRERYEAGKARIKNEAIKSYLEKLKALNGLDPEEVVNRVQGIIKDMENEIGG